METYLPSFKLDGKTALITGATKGIGRAISIAYAEAGANLILVARSEDDLNSLKSQLEADFGSEVSIINESVNNHKNIIDQINHQLPETTINVLVNNAGMNIRSEALNVSEEEWSQIIDTNMKSAFFLSQYVAKQLKNSNQPGKIISISSVAGQTGLRTGVVYGMTKAALIQMTKTLAIEWGKYGICVNAIGPWYFPTALTEKLLQNEGYVKEIEDRTPLGRVGELNEIAGPAVFLASDASNYVSGQTLMVDGGMTIYGF
ncbi:SDR family NAD(P)-dependent oxidoreductase [Halalkalibacillus halophilus]|uniref:SDR family NAD(P)-dependent oxidoreductase n=1 Tax=Halalkalibacillus halophilus TaxID=392827 RepID=UPI0003F9A1AE|nr:SDR family oxidoreductase [Halalkalibacillus halophilus]